MKARKYLTGLVLALMLSVCAAAPAMASDTDTSADNTATPTVISTTGFTVGVIQDGSSWYYAENGVKASAPATWKTIDGKTYYFDAKSRALTGLAKVKGVYYVFDAKGVLQKASSGKAVVTVNKTKYLVDTKGRAKKNAWDSKKTMYFGKKYVPVTGTQVVNGKFYSFTKKGVKNAKVTKKLQAASRYNKSSFASLKKLIGKPQKSKYTTGCFGSGKDGKLTYPNFIVYTYKEGNKEVVMTVDATKKSPTYNDEY